MPANLSEIFEKRERQFSSQYKSYLQKDTQISWLRFGVFVAFTVGLVYLANAHERTAFIVLLLAFPFVFGLLVKYHNSLRAQKLMAQYLTRINKEESLRLKHQFQAFDDGQHYLDPLHPYAIDMDIFGHNSLYQLVCRATTQNGQDELARWLSVPAAKEEILQRQQAVEELKHKLEWRQDFQAAGKQGEEGREEVALHELLQWLNTPVPLLRKGLMKIAAFVLPVLTIALLALVFGFGFSYYYLLPAVILNGSVLMKLQRLAAETHTNTTNHVKLLKAYASLIQLIEEETFESERLNALKKTFYHEKHKASQEIKKLQQILDFFDSRSNMMYHILNIFFLLDLQALFRAERWKANMQADVKSWFDAISSFEALTSLAGFAYLNPAYILPVISENPHTLKAESVGHPLIPADKRVVNDFSLNGKGAIAIVTGSNMSGKSTFERTVGINMVLALAGAPVCAGQMEVSVTQVFSSMRTTDSLEESVSSFYAELKRLRQLLETLKEGRPVFFLLDEILKGTNSIDRHKGAEGLIHQLSELNASGMVSTHDMELSRLADEMPSVVNYSFESQIEGDRILFDYKLKHGPCRSFNASKLMENMGIRVAKGERP